jgi:hypothetical protein
MANLEESLQNEPREVYLVYLKPEFDHLVERVSSLRKLWQSNFTMSEQDFAAYAFPDQSEVCAAYGSA